MIVVKKNLPASAEDIVDVCSISGLGRYLELEMAVLSSILVWRITRTEEPGGLNSMGSQRVRQD